MIGESPRYRDGADGFKGKEKGGGFCEKVIRYCISSWGLCLNNYSMLVNRPWYSQLATTATSAGASPSTCGILARSIGRGLSWFPSSFTTSMWNLSIEPGIQWFPLRSGTSVSVNYWAVLNTIHCGEL